MVVRALCTAAALSVSGLGFFDTPATADIANPLGIAFLMVSGVIWLGWDMFRDAYAFREEVCANSGKMFLATERLGPAMVDRLVRRTGE